MTKGWESKRSQIMIVAADRGVREQIARELSSFELEVRGSYLSAYTRFCQGARPALLILAVDESAIKAAEIILGIVNHLGTGRPASMVVTSRWREPRINDTPIGFYFMMVYGASHCSLPLWHSTPWDGLKLQTDLALGMREVERRRREMNRYILEGKV